MRVLVCGGAGYIGSHMCKRLAEHGHAVEVVDDLSTGHRAAVQWGRLHHRDLGDAAFINELIERIAPDAVMHFAARSLVGESMADPAAYYHNNVAKTLVLLDAVRRRPGCVFVFSSTAAVFGDPMAPLIDESHPQQPINPYGTSKRMVEQVLADYWRAYGLASVSLRYFNAAGAERQARIGEAHDPETHLIPRILESVLGRGEPVRIYGDDYPTADGTCVRDYIHVEDLCQAHLAALQRLRTHPGCHAYNLGNGQGFSVREVLQTAQAVVGRRIDYAIAPRRPGDPPRLVADATAAARDLGWQPQQAELHEIVESAWRWHRARAF